VAERAEGFAQASDGGVSAEVINHPWPPYGYDLRLSFAVNDSAPAPQQGQLMATRMLCFSSSSRSLRSSMARVCCANRSCSETPPLWLRPSSDAGALPIASGGGGGANLPEALVGRRAMAESLLLADHVHHAVEVAAQEARHVVLDGGQRALGVDVAESAEMRR